MDDRLIELLIKIVILGGGGLLVAWMKKKAGKVKIVALFYVIGQALFICLTLFLQIILIHVTLEIFQEGDIARALGFVVVSVFMFLGTLQKIKLMMKSILKMLGKELEEKEINECTEDS